jgi:pyruvate formate lyase activating enzyme
MKEAYLYKKLPKNKVQCKNCAHYCLISENQKGLCQVRKNIKGKLFTLNYEKLIACNVDPIEKKPLFHFLPGSCSLSVATVGCNFRCDNCQNYSISQFSKIKDAVPGKKIEPEKIVKLAIENNTPSISYTYTEPVIFLEYALDTMRIAKKQGIKNVWVSNGFLSKESFNLISPYLDAANIDLKGFSDDFYRKNCGGKLQPILNTLTRIKNKKIWLEITTLVIPELSDQLEMFEKIAKFIKKELGAETPWHLTQFYSKISWKLKKLPDTPVEILKKAWRIGKDAGLKYVYNGNVQGLESENTFCPKCGSLMIKRTGYDIKRFDIEGKCAKCKNSLNLILN